MPVLLRPWPDARASYSNERETQSLGKLRWWALPKGDRRAVSTQECRRGGAPPPDKPGNDDSSLHVASESSTGQPSNPDFSSILTRRLSVGLLARCAGAGFGRDTATKLRRSAQRLGRGGAGAG